MPLKYLGLVLFLLGAFTAGAADRRTCAPGGTAYARADKELVALDAAITALGPDAETGKLMERLRGLTCSPCFALRDGCIGSSAVRAQDLKDYWSGGGHRSLRSMLDLGKKGSAVLYLPPTLRVGLHAEAFSCGSPVRALVCRPDDLSCGAETEVWSARARTALSGASTIQDPCYEQYRGAPEGRPETVAACAGLVRGIPGRYRLDRYLACAETTRARRKELPRGRLRLPSEGWLTIANRLGHFACDGVWAYDLFTGAAIHVEHCGGSAAKIDLGQVPAEAVREAAWMLLMLEAVEEGPLEGLAVPVPAGMPRTRPPVDADLQIPGRYSSCHVITTSADTKLNWRLQTAGLVVDAGELTWPRNGGDAAGQHALSLLGAAQQKFVPGCPSVKVPLDLFGDGPESSCRELRADPDRVLADPVVADGWGRALAEIARCGVAAR
jgi:hypothetical protein